MEKLVLELAYLGDLENWIPNTSKRETFYRTPKDKINNEIVFNFVKRRISRLLKAIYTGEIDDIVKEDEKINK